MKSDDPRSPEAMPRRGGLRVLAGSAAAAVDPVCGMTVDPNAGKPSTVHEGDTYWFCSAGCKAKFEADPAKYLAGQREPMGHRAAVPPALPAAGQPTPASAKWICPM